MDKDKPPPVARTVEDVLEDFWWRRRALTDKEQREVISPVSSQASNGSILNSESEDEDNDGDDDDDDEDEDNDGDDYEDEDEDDDEMEEDEEEHEEIERKNENGDLMDEDEEENEKAFCRACGNNDGADEFWICCDLCKKRFHGNCIKFTPALEEDQKKCPLCRARTNDSSIC